MFSRLFSIVLAIYFVSFSAFSSYTRTFETGFVGFENQGDYSFSQHTGSTPSGSTGPSGGANGTAGYAYMETSSGAAYNAGNTAELFHEINGATQVSFYYHMYGADMGTLSVQVWDNGVRKTIWSKSGQQHSSLTSAWTKVTLDISSYTGSSDGEEQELYIVGTAVGGYRGDMAIDEVEVSFEPVASSLNTFESSFGQFISNGPKTAQLGVHGDHPPGWEQGPYTGADNTEGYVYFKANGTSYFETSTLPSRYMSFYYNMNGEDVGTLSVETYISGTWTRIWEKVGAQHSSSHWGRQLLYIPSNSTKLRFVAEESENNTFNLGDIAIDEVDFDPDVNYNLLDTSFESGLDWQNTGIFDWSRHTGGTSSSGTGPSAADSGNYYAYMETSSGSAYFAGNTAILESDLFYIHNNINFCYNYSMVGENIGSLKLQGLNHKNTWETLAEYTGEQATSSEWPSDCAVVEPYIQKLRFVGVAAGGYKGDIALDDFYSEDADEIESELSNGEVVKYTQGYDGYAYFDIDNLTAEVVYYRMDESEPWQLAISENDQFKANIGEPDEDNITLYFKIADYSGRLRYESFDVDVESVQASAPGSGSINISTDQYRKDYVNNYDETVGETKGNFSVTPSGSASYNIPLTLPKGAAGLTPQLSLNYNSNGGNGLVGKGWAIGGLSSITRCGQTYLHDNQNTGVSWGWKDRFCFNGQRLFVESGTYGAVGASYTTEIESHLSIESVGGSTGKPSYFKITHQDGSQSYFGHTSNARQVNEDNDTYKWAISKKQYTPGNFISFEYDNLTSDHTFKIDRIYYGGYSVQYNYNEGYTREDTSKRMIGGYPFEMKDLLTSVEISRGSENLRTYDLEYETSPLNAIQKMNSIQECVDTTCFPATTFAWSPDDYEFMKDEKSSDVFSGMVYFSGIGSGDIDGDGITDLVLSHAGEEGNAKYSYFLGGEDGFSEAHEINEGKAYPSSFKSIVVKDFNGDGRADLTNLESACKAYYTQYDSGNTWSAASPQEPDGCTNINGTPDELLDINGDGIPDKVSLSTYGATQVTYTGRKDIGGGVSIDVKHSFYSKRKLSIRLGRLYNASFSESSSRYVWDTIQHVDLPAIESRQFEGVTVDGYSDAVIYGDFDGDGVLDIIVRQAAEPNDNTQYQLHDTHYVFKLPSITDEASLGTATLLNQFEGDLAANGTILVADINSDGLSDIIKKRYWVPTDDNDEEEMWVSYSLGGTSDFEYVSTYSTENDKDDNTGVYGISIPSGDFSLLDINLDGKLELYINKQAGTGYVALGWDGEKLVKQSEYFGDDGAGDDEFFYFADFTGDGRPDRISFDRRDDGSLRRATYRGISFTTSEQAVEPVGHIDKIITGTGHTTEIKYDQLALTSHYKPFDIYADGPDEIWDSLCVINNDTSCESLYDSRADSADSFYQRLFDGPLLPEAGSDSLGEALPITPVTSGMTIVTRVTNDNPHTSSVYNAGSVNTNAKKNVYYYYGRAFSQSQRGSLGFETITKSDYSSDLEIQTVYRQDFPFTGRAAIEQVRTTGGDILSTTYTDWRTNFVGNTRAFPYQVYADKVVASSFDPESGDLLKITQNNTTLDEYGYTDTAVAEILDGSGYTVKTETTSITPSNNCADRGLPGSVSVLHEGDFTSKTLTTAYSYYDNSCWLESETVEPGDADYEVTTSYSYDSNGNPEEVTLSADGLTSRTSKTIYDESGRYVEEQRNAKGHLVQKVTKANAYGLPETIVGLNGVETYIDYDAFGRQIKQSSNVDDNWVATAMQWCDYVVCPTGAVMRVEQSDASGARAYQYVNKIGQTIRTSQKGFDGTDTHVDMEYDIDGNLRFQSPPYYDGDIAYWTRYTYDVLGRETSIRNPDGSISTITYDGFTTTHRNALSQNKIETHNALGQLIQVEDDIGGKVINTYTALGNLDTATSGAETGAGIVVDMTYDQLGRKVGMNDPDKGIWSYQYNAYGELESQVNAKGEVTSNTYDVLGRLETRTDKTSASGSVINKTQWYFDGATPTGAPNRSGSAIGLVSAVVHSDSGTTSTCNSTSVQYCQSFSYDTFGRPLSETKALGAQGNLGTFTTGVEYDAIGRVLKEFDAYADALALSNPSGVYHHYNEHGYAYGISEFGSSVNNVYEGIYQVLSMNASGQVTSSQRGNNAVSDYEYDPRTNRILSQKADGLNSYPIQHIEYQWDRIGNLRNRANYSGRSVTGYSTAVLQETFCYDNLNRLTGVETGLSYSCTSSDLQYDSIGNITYKKEVGDYTYGQNGAGPHAVTHTSIGDIEYTYDANGNLTSDDEGRTITYTVFDKPDYISKDGHVTEFEYGPDRMRWKRIDKALNGDVTTTLYIGSTEKVTKTDSVGNASAARHGVTWERYLGSFALYSIETSGSTVQNISRKYLYKDYQGSVDVITNEFAKVITLMSFDAWGKRRDGYTAEPFTSLDELINVIDQQLGSSVPIFEITTKGYTGHEMLDEVGLIHMNGRVYNPTLARFVSADPIISNPDDTQNYNRYSYVHNRPMFFTDPSGFETAGDEEEEPTLEFVQENGEVVAIVATTSSGETHVVSVDSDGGLSKDATISADGQTVETSEGINSIDGGTGSTEKITSIGTSDNNQHAAIDPMANKNQIFTLNGTETASTNGIMKLDTSGRAAEPKENKQDRKDSLSMNKEGKKGGWKRAGAVYGKGQKGTIRAGNKVRIKAFDDKGIALTNGIHYKISFTQIDADGNPMDAISPEWFGQDTTFLPAGNEYEIGSQGETYDWHIETLKSGSSCDNCGEPGVILENYEYY